MMASKTRAFGYVLLLAALLSCCRNRDLPKVTVFAAASTTNALKEISEVFTEESSVPVVLSFASSSTLAKQIERGAPAEIYLSANPTWVDYLENKNKIEPRTRLNLLNNQLVLIAPIGSSVNEVHVSEELDFRKLLGTEKLAMGDPDHVPAGIYGKQSLRSLGMWNGIEPQVARAMDVRAALALVERKEAPLGIVYATDALISKRVKVVGTFPEDTHPLITYPISVVRGKTTPEVTLFLGFLEGPKAKAIFEKYGFVMP